MRERNRTSPSADRLVPAALLLKAVGAGRPAGTRRSTGYWLDDAFRPADSVHLGVAVSLRGGGLVAPALRDAEDLPLDELMARLQGPGRAGPRRAGCAGRS